MNVTIKDMQAYLADRYSGWATEQGMFLKLVEELGEVAEVVNKRSKIKPKCDFSCQNRGVVPCRGGKTGAGWEYFYM